MPAHWPNIRTSTRRIAFRANRDSAQQRPDIICALLVQLRTTVQWVNQHPDETAALIAPKVGLDEKLVQTWVRRYPYGTTAVTDDLVRSQQNVADRCYGAHLIPQKIPVRDNVWQNSEVAASLAAK